MGSSRRPSRSNPRKSVRLNYRFAGILLATVLVLMVAAWGLRRSSMSRNAGAFLQFARNQYAAGDIREALRASERYLKMVPNDPAGIDLFAELVDQVGMGGEDLQTAYQILSDFAVRNPDRRDIKERLFRFAFELRRYGELVENHLPEMRDLVMKDREYLRMAVDSFRALSLQNAGLTMYLSALEKRPEDVGVYSDLIDFLSEDEFTAVDLAVVHSWFSSDSKRKAGEGRGDDAQDAGLINDNLRDLARQDDGVPTRGKGDEPDDDEGVDRELVEELTGQDQETATLNVFNLVDLILQRALEAGRPEVDARILRGRIWLRRSLFDQSLAELEKATALDERNPDMLSLKVELLMQQRAIALVTEDGSRAAQLLESILALKDMADDGRDGSWTYHSLLGQVLLETGDEPAAETQFRLSSELGLKQKESLPPSIAGRSEGLRIDFLTRWGLVNCLIESSYRNSPQTVEEEEILKKKREEILTLTEELRRLGAIPSLIEYLDARILLVQRKWGEAAERFESIRANISETPEILRFLDQSLVECYRRLRNPDEMIRALQRAVSDDRTWFEGRLALADAYLMVGREDLAMDEFAQVSSVAAVPTMALRVSVRRELLRPESKRDWSKIQAVLDDSLGRNPWNADLLSIQADVLRFQGKTDEAIEKLEEARKAKPDDDTLVAVEVGVLVRGSDVNRKYLDQATALLGEIQRDSAVLRLARAELEMARGEAQLGTRLQGLAEGLDAFSQSQQKLVLQRLAAMAESAGFKGDALKLLDHCLAIEPDDLEVLSERVALLIETGVSANDLEPELTRVRNLEVNPRPNYHYLAGLHDLRDYRILGDTEDEGVKVARVRLLRSAEQNLEIASRGRPSWVAAKNEYANTLYELGEEDSSFRIARQLLTQGTPTPDAVTNTVRYLLKNQRDEELLEVVRELEESSPRMVSEDVSRAGMLASYRTRRWDETMNRLGKLESSTLEDSLIQAQLMIARRDDPRRIEELLTNALSLAPDQQMVWFLWVSFLVREGRTVEARGTLERIKEEVPEEPQGLRPLILAQCEEILNEIDQADQHYMEAHGGKVANLPLINEHISFCVRHNRLLEAQNLLKILFDENSGLDPEARSRAEILYAKLRAVTAKSYDEFEEALATLQADKELSKVSAAHLRAQLVLYAGVGRSREQKKMISILEELFERKLLTSAESTELAWLYARNWRWPDAVVLYRRILEREPDNLRALASFVEAALRRSELDERTKRDVARAVSQLEVRDPDSLRTLIAQARFLQVEGRLDEVEQMIRQFVDKLERSRVVDQFREVMDTARAPAVLQVLNAEATRADDANALAIINALATRSLSGDDPQLVFQLGKYIDSPRSASVIREQLTLFAASIAEVTEQFPLAEELYLKARSLGQSPDSQLTYLSFLARRSRFTEAFELWQQIKGDYPPQMQARFLAAIVRAGKAPSEVCAKVEKLVREILINLAEDDVTGRVGVLVALADVYDLQERFPEARGVYGQILELSPREVTALNNLAILNSFEESLAIKQRGGLLIDQAIEIVGPVPALLDSRALVSLNLEQADSALDDLRKALEQNSDSIFWLHLAYAQLKKNDMRGAAESFERANAYQMDVEKLHPLERPMFEELRRRLGSGGG